MPLTVRLYEEHTKDHDGGFTPMAPGATLDAWTIF
jgi:hypothetical protein